MRLALRRLYHRGGVEAGCQDNYWKEMFEKLEQVQAGLLIQNAELAEALRECLKDLEWAASGRCPVPAATQHVINKGRALLSRLAQEDQK